MISPIDFNNPAKNWEDPPSCYREKTKNLKNSQAILDNPRLNLFKENHPVQIKCPIDFNQ